MTQTWYSSNNAHTPYSFSNGRFNQKITVRFKRGRTKGFRQNIRMLLFRSHDLKANFLGTKSLSDETETHIYVLAPRRTKKVPSKPPDYLQKLGHTIRLALDE